MSFRCTLHPQRKREILPAETQTIDEEVIGDLLQMEEGSRRLDRHDDVSFL